MLAPLSDIKEISEIERIVKGNANAVLFILPNNESSLNELKSLLNQAQVLLCNIIINIAEKVLYLPIYFCYENEEILSVLEMLKDEYEQSGNYSDHSELPEVILH